MQQLLSKVRTRGFTIIELLIVIVVIGILAAITILAYNGVQNGARDNAVVSDLESVASEVTRYQVNHTGVFSTDGSGSSVTWYSGSGTNSNISFAPSSGDIIDVVANNTDYCIRGYNPGSKTYTTLATAASKGSTASACSTLAPSSAAQAVSPLPVNYAYQTDFESGAGIWSVSHGDSTLTNSTAVFHSGAKSMKLVHTDTFTSDGHGGGSGDNGDGLRATISGLTIGVHYTFSGWVYTTTAGTGSTTDAYWFPIGSTSGPAVSLAANTWTKITLAFTATSTSQYVFLYATNHDYTQGNGVTRTVYFDDISVTY